MAIISTLLRFQTPRSKPDRALIRRSLGINDGERETEQGSNKKVEIPYTHQDRPPICCDIAGDPDTP
jgi:hypothetical protein